MRKLTVKEMRKLDGRGARLIYSNFNQIMNNKKDIIDFEEPIGLHLVGDCYYDEKNKLILSNELYGIKHLYKLLNFQFIF